MAAVPDSTSTAILVAVAGGAGAFAGAAFSAWLSQHGRRKERRQEQQRADAAVLGPVMAFLTDVDPDRLGFNIRPDVTEQEKVMSPLRDRLDGIHGSLLVLAAGHPSDQVSDLARQLAIAVRSTFTSAAWLVQDLIRHSELSYRDKAKEDHEQARTLAEDLLNEIARLRARLNRLRSSGGGAGHVYGPKE
jgi:hypothetical protein